MNKRVSRLEWRIDVLAQALAEVEGLTQYPQHESLRRLARIAKVAHGALARAGDDCFEHPGRDAEGRDDQAK